MTEDTCPLFTFCNCKTAMCRVVLPDESCYWYRYFKKLIQQRQSEKEKEAMKKYFETKDPIIRNIKAGRGLKEIHE